MIQQHFDALVVGAGPGGYPCAIRLAQLGKKTAVIEKAELGGVCLNQGCIPSKALIHAAELAHGMSDLAAIGIEVPQVRVDLPKVIAWKRGIVKKLSQGVGQLFKAWGVETLRGTARFRGATTVELSRPDSEGGNVMVTADDVVVATGVHPIELDDFPFDGQNVIGAREALDMEQAPRRLLVIGGGYIGLELGTAWRKLGSEVIVVEFLDRLLGSMDPEAVRYVEKRLKSLGVRVLTSTRACDWEPCEGGIRVRLEGPDGEKKIEVDRVLSAVGMAPDNRRTHLSALDVQTDARGYIQVDARQRTNLEHLYAVGDCAGGMLLAHKATRQGIVAAEAIAGLPTVFEDRAIPWGVFTDPEVAGVGITEAQARAENRPIKVGKFPFLAVGRALTMNRTEGFVKLFADPESDELLGACVVGASATELVAEIALGIELGATVGDLARTIHLHPTLPEAVMEAAEAVHDQAIHLPPPRRR